MSAYPIDRLIDNGTSPLLHIPDPWPWLVDRLRRESTVPIFLNLWMSDREIWTAGKGGKWKSRKAEIKICRKSIRPLSVKFSSYIFRVDPSIFRLHVLACYKRFQNSSELVIYILVVAIAHIGEKGWESANDSIFACLFICSQASTTCFFTEWWVLPFLL